MSGARDLVKSALDAERTDAADAARLAAIEAKLAARLAQPSAPPPASPGGFLGAKTAWMLAGVAVVGAAALVLSRGSSSTAPPAPAVATPATGHVADVAPPTPAEPALVTVSPADLPTAREPIAVPSARALVRTPSPEQAEGEEIALLARAHEALRTRPGESLTICGEHAQRFAGGHFVQEREAVAIEALVYLNRRAEAERRFETFQQRYPTSSHRGHLESLLSAAPTSPR